MRELTAFITGLTVGLLIATGLLLIFGCTPTTHDNWCAVTYHFSPPDSGWAHPDSVDLTDPNAKGVQPDSVVIEDCNE